MLETMDKKLLKKAREDQELLGKIAKACGRSVPTVMRWLDNDHHNIPPIAYGIIEKYFDKK